MDDSRRVLCVMPAIIILLITVLSVTAQISESSSGEDSELLTQIVYEEIERATVNITNVMASRFKFCITDVQKDRKQAFDFSPDLDFLTKCIDETRGDLLLRLCGVAEIKFYFQNYIANLGSTGGYSKPNKNCNSTSWVPGCEPGWASALSETTNDTKQNDLQYSQEMPARTQSSQRCCDGFFCPRGLTCMIPCPLGAYCTKAKLDITTGLCKPYQYQLPPQKRNHTCGGADLWADVGSTKQLFCPAGFYCPTTTERKICSSGHYCRLGSTSETRCFQLTSCDSNTTHQNIQTYGLMLIAVIMTLLLIIYNCSDQVMLIRERRRAKSREAAAKRARESTKARERWRLAKEAAKRQAVNLQRQLSRSFSRNHSRKHTEELHVLAPAGMLMSDEISIFPVSPMTEGGVWHESSGGLTPVTKLTNYLGKKRHSPDENLHDREKGPTLAFSVENVRSKATKSRPAHSRTQVFKYAYGQIEKEKAMEKGHLTLTEAISKVGSYGGQARPKIEVAFEDLSLTLKGNGKRILRNVTGKLMPGHIAAVMGPSGAGKTTFLNAVAGKALGCIVTGSVFINGRPESMHSYKKIIGFVPQDDIIHGSLTVEENLWFSAKCRLPVCMPEPEKVLVVERIIEALRLQSIRDSLVGTVERRGISGGQRKRVNVGLEMVMEPSLLILDEPTSGLDSSSSQLLLKALRREALAGVNICMVLHQPSYGLFKMFDDLTLLAKGGWTVYHGPVDEVENYFSSLGFIIPEHVNPIDHFMDVLEGIVKPARNPKFDCNTLPITWMHRNGYEIPTELQQNVAGADASTSKETSKTAQKEPLGIANKTSSFGQELWGELRCNMQFKWDNIRHMFLRVNDLSQRQTPGFLKQFRFFLGRVAKQRFRESWIQTQDYLILLLAGACLGILAKVNDESFAPVGYTYTVIAMSLLCMISALRTFSLDKLQYWRESASGMNRVAYFLAKDSVDHFNTVIKPLVYLSMFYYFNNPRSSFASNYAVTLVLVYCVVGIAYIFAITFEAGAAQLWSVFLPIVFTLVATQRKTNSTWKHLIDLSYSRWALEAYVIANAERYSGVWLISRCGALQSQGYDLDDWTLCIGILVGYGVVARLIAFVCLLACNRDRQK